MIAMRTAAPSEGSHAYWIERARSTTGVAAVHPSGRWLRYHAWTRDMLARWTLQRVTADRRRFRRVVDLGCGRGDWLAQFAPHGDELFACDVSDVFVEQTRARLAGIDHPAFEVTRAELETYGIPRELDLAHLGCVLTYMADRDAADTFVRVREAAARDALVVVRDWCTFNLGRRSVNHTTGFSVHRTPSELRVMGERAGLRCIEVRASPSIYAELWGAKLPALRYPLRAVWRLATLHWLRASHILLFRAP
jgi:SAM-dependent methyltransferase